jgi:hypothetical protein
MRIVPLGGVASMALVSRFSNTWRRLSASAGTVGRSGGRSRCRSMWRAVRRADSRVTASATSTVTSTGVRRTGTSRVRSRTLRISSFMRWICDSTMASLSI